MTEIGERVGFESLYAFSRAFKGETGASPLAYRRAASRRSRTTGGPPNAS
jgi:AraC-like DNA-binding protein